MIVGGAALTLAQLLLHDPDRDAAETTGRMAEDLLRMLGLSAAEAGELARRPLPDLDDLVSAGQG